MVPFCGSENLARAEVTAAVKLGNDMSIERHRLNATAPKRQEAWLGLHRNILTLSHRQ